MDLSKLSTNDRLVAGGGIVLFIASFLPWFEVSVAGFGSESGNGWDVGFLWAGLPALLGLAAAAIVALKASGTELPDLPISWNQAIFAAGALSAVLVILKLLIGIDEPAGFEALGGDVSRQFGIYLATLAALAFAFGGFRKFQDDKAAPSAI